MNYHFVLISFIFMKRLFECKSVFGLQRFTEVYRGSLSALLRVLESEGLLSY